MEAILFFLEGVAGVLKELEYITVKPYQFQKRKIIAIVRKHYYIQVGATRRGGLRQVVAPSPINVDTFNDALTLSSGQLRLIL
jgi:hypothetical protein